VAAWRLPLAAPLLPAPGVGAALVRLCWPLEARPWRSQAALAWPVAVVPRWSRVARGFAPRPPLAAVLVPAPCVVAQQVRFSQFLLVALSVPAGAAGSQRQWEPRRAGSTAAAARRASTTRSPDGPAIRKPDRSLGQGRLDRPERWGRPNPDMATAVLLTVGWRMPRLHTSRHPKRPAKYVQQHDVAISSSTCPFPGFQNHNGLAVGTPSSQEHKQGPLRRQPLYRSLFPPAHQCWRQSGMVNAIMLSLQGQEFLPLCSRAS
jgi:hypothetical protein